MNRVWTSVVGAATIVSGCALVDAWYGEVPEPQCVWRDCSCGVDELCDPRDDCTPTRCRRCESGAECDGNDLCRVDTELCSSCDDQTPTEPQTICVDGECFVCEADSDDPNQYCVRDTCFF